VLNLKIGKVIFKDYSNGIPPKVSEFNVNIDQRFENITDPQALAKLIIVKALMNTTIANLANFDLGSLKEGVTKTFGKAVEFGGELGGTAKSVVEGVVGETTDTFKKILPFERKK